MTISTASRCGEIGMRGNEAVAHECGLVQRHRAAAGADAERSGRHAARSSPLRASAQPISRYPAVTAPVDDITPGSGIIGEEDLIQITPTMQYPHDLRRTIPYTIKDSMATRGVGHCGDQEGIGRL